MKQNDAGDDIEYEYTLSPMRTVVLVHRKPKPDAPIEPWHTYMRCDDEQHAKRILALLQAEPMGERAYYDVRP